MMGRVPKWLGLLAACCVAAAGCAVVKPTDEPAAAAVPAPSEPVPAAVAKSGATAPPSPAPVSKSTNEPSEATPPKTTTDSARHVTETKPPPAVPARPVTEPTRPVPATPPVAAPSTLDFTSLVARLRATKAIGVLTKLAVKNQSDDLLEKFRAYHKRQGTASLAELHSAYEGLMLKLLALLQDGDPPLATDIDRSRAAIWDILADPMKFIESNLMAGASQ